MEQRSADPFNRFLARAGRSRLPAEQIRDLSLAAGGLLDQRIGGASVFPVQPGNYWGEKGQEKRNTHKEKQEEEERVGKYMTLGILLIAGRANSGLDDGKGRNNNSRRGKPSER